MIKLSKVNKQLFNKSKIINNKKRMIMMINMFL